MAQLVYARPDEPAARPLLADLSAREAQDFLPPRGVFLLAVSGTTTVAGGGIAPLVAGVAEVRRLWTAPEHRDLAQRLLAALEHEAQRLGYRALRLESGFEKRLVA